MARGPTDLPDHRPAGDDDFAFGYAPEFDIEFERLVPDARERSFFKTGGLEWRLNRRHDLHMIEGDLERGGRGVLINEDGFANVPACLASFTIRVIDGTPWCRFDRLHPVPVSLDDEDDS
jgi:hypothetical protein